jgi:hypothetical protein
MVMREVAALARAGAGAAGGLARDALGDLAGRSLPWRESTVCQPAMFNALLRDGAVRPWPQPPAVRAITRQPVPSISSNCENLVLTLEQAGPPLLPASVFVKLPMDSLLTRAFMGVIRSWHLESRFFRTVAPELPLRTPKTFATAARGTRFYLVQENLREDPSVTLFTNPDMMRGPSLDLVSRVLDMFARLHAWNVGLDPRARDAILPLDLHPFLSPRLAPVSRSLNRLALDPCLRRRPGAVPERVAAAYRESMAHWPRLIEHWFAGPLSLLHGDSHLGNVFIDGDAMGLLDWQAAHWGKGIRDVQYFLIDALPEATLAANERDLVDYYVERRAVHGAPLDAESAWQDYRSFTFHTLFTICVAVGFGALNEEQDALMAEILDRAVAAVERVDYPGWLREFLLV